MHQFSVGSRLETNWNRNNIWPISTIIIWPTKHTHTQTNSSAQQIDSMIKCVCVRVCWTGWCQFASKWFACLAVFDFYRNIVLKVNKNKKLLIYLIWFGLACLVPFSSQFYIFLLFGKFQYRKSNEQNSVEKKNGMKWNGLANDWRRKENNAQEIYCHPARTNFEPILVNRTKFSIFV